MFSHRDVMDASRLVSYAINAGVRPSTEAEYGRLLRRYLDNEGDFATCADGILAGLRLRAVGASERTGLVVAASETSPLAIRLGDYYKRMKGRPTSEDRFLHGLVHVAVATYCFPHEQSLASPEPVDVTVRGVQRFIDQVAADLHDPDAHPETTSEELTEAWRLWNALSDVSDSADGRYTPSSKPGRISQVLKVLEQQVCLRTTGENMWATTERYRLLVRDASSDDPFVVFAAQADAAGATSVESGATG